MKGRGARDALAFLVMSWILALNQRKKVAVYCSDVSGLLTGYGPRDFWKNSDAKELTLPWSNWWDPGHKRTAQVVVEGRSDKMLPRQGSWKSSMLTT